MGLAVALLGSHSEYSEASDYTGNRQAQSWGKPSSDYATRWARDTKPWSRGPSGTGQSGVDSDYSQWANKSFERDGPSDRTRYVSDFRQSDGWYQDSPVRTRQRPERGQETPESWESPRRERQVSSGEQQDSWAKLKDWQEPNQWVDPRSASSRWDDGWSGSTARSQGNQSDRSVDSYGGTRRYGGFQSPSPEPPRDYSSAGTSSGEQDPWAKDPWARNPRENSPPASGRYTPDIDPSQDRKYWEYSQSMYGEDRPWGRQGNDQPQTKQPPNPVANAHSGLSPNPSQPGHFEYPGYLHQYQTPSYPGMWEYGAAYGPEYGYGHYGWGHGESWYPGFGSMSTVPGFGNMPMVGDLLGFPFW